MGKKARKPRNARIEPGSLAIPSIVSIALVGVLALFQGGFYAGAVCVVGLVSAIAFSIAALLRKVEVACPWQSACLLFIAVFYLVSAIVHGSTFSMLEETAVWFAAAGISLWCAFGTAREKQNALDALASTGVVLSALGILMFFGVLPLQGVVSAGRLMFTLQYANTAGLMFAVFAVLCLCSDDRKRQIAGIVPLIALLLTQSIGAIAVFVLAVIALVAVKVAEGKLAGKYVVIVCVLVVALAVIAGVVFQGRVSQAMQTFLERIIQMSDASALLARNIALGIGPDQWQFVYQDVQTAQYLAAEVHCSYLQIALDAGVLAGIAAVALLGFGMVRLAKRRDFASLICVGMVAVHALVDFDLQFACIVVLAAFLMAEPREGERAQVVPPAASRVLCWVVAACCMLACAAGVFLDVRAGEIQSAAARGDSTAASELLVASPVFASDGQLRMQVIESQYAAGHYENVEELAGQDAAGFAGLYRAASQFRLGNSDAAASTLRDTLDGQPYHVELYEAARQFIVDANAGDVLVQVYNDAAARANELAHAGHAAWLEGQEHIDEIS